MLPRRRQPSPTLKVDRAQPGPDEGKQPKSEKQATLNGSNLHPMWPVSLFGCGPLIRHALRRATFPVGEGDLPAGAFHTLSWERVAGPKALTGVGRTKPPARRSLSQPGADSSLYAREPAPHPSRLTACHLPRGGRLPPAGEHSSGPGLNFQGSPPHPSRLRRSTLSKQERAYLSSQAK